MSGVHLTTLVLNNNYMPVSVFPLYTIAAQDAIVRYLNGNCDVVFWYDRPILTPSRTDLYWPSVIVNRNSKSFRNEVRLKKTTLYYRDHCVCYYCGTELSLNKGAANHITFDHYMPKKHGGTHAWDNVVAACKPCNAAKDDALPKGRWAPSKYKPYKPTFMQLLNIRQQYPLVIHDENWLQFLPGWSLDKVIVRMPSAKEFDNVIELAA